MKIDQEAMGLINTPRFDPGEAYTGEVCVKRGSGFKHRFNLQVGSQCSIMTSNTRFHKDSTHNLATELLTRNSNLVFDLIARYLAM